MAGLSQEVLGSGGSAQVKVDEAVEAVGGWAGWEWEYTGETGLTD